MTWGKLLCWIGAHHWDAHSEVDFGTGWVFDFAWCQRAGCRYEEPRLVKQGPPTAAGGPSRL